MERSRDAAAERHDGSGESGGCGPAPCGGGGRGGGRVHAAGGRSEPRARSLLRPVTDADAFSCAQPHDAGESEGLLRVQGELVQNVR